MKPLRITLLCSSAEHPVMPTLREWADKYKNIHHITILQHAKDAQGGDILFLISCSEIIKKNTRQKYDHILVIHASDLPHGRGWSPHIWQILEGKSQITVSLLEAADKVDAGDIWHKISVPLQGHELYDEINQKLFTAELELMDFAIKNCHTITPLPQNHTKATYYPKRTPADSEVEPHKPLMEHFNLLRTVDPHRFPAFFKAKGHTYLLKITKQQTEN